MFFNSSSNASNASNASLISPLHCFSNPKAYPFVFSCSENLLSSAIIASFIVTNLLFLLPIYILIFWIGLRRWWRQRSVSSGITSHSDAITYNMVTLEIVTVLGITLFCIGMFSCSVGTMTAGYYILSVTYPGLCFLHCMTCIEHYLAVVHPVTYLGSKQAGGIRIRNIAIGLVWIVCFGEAVMIVLRFPDFPIFVVLAIVALCLSVVSFCCISALRVLIGLRKVGGDRERIDQSKQRAFFTICAILATLMMRFTGLLVSNFLMDKITETHTCSLLMSGFWLYLPSSLILPLLFLHRAGMLACLSPNRNQQ